jgi:inorganic pyrophosphatase
MKGLHPWHDIEAGPEPPNRLHAIVEIPRGGRNKYEVDKPTGLFRLDRILYSAVHYPGDYGFIPRTLAEDDDPLDVLVMVTAPTFPGCLIDVRPLGLFEMKDEAAADQKVLCVPIRDPNFDQHRTLADVPRHFLREVEHFFTIYKELEGKRTEVIGWSSLEDARRVVEEALARYDAARPTAQ